MAQAEYRHRCGRHPDRRQHVQVIARLCSVETMARMEAAAAGARAGGARLMRGGAFKPRTSPYAFQGKGVEGLEMLRSSADAHGLPIVTELMDVRMLETFLQYDVDVIQIGTRNMQNFDLLKEVGRIKKPVILKRGMSATINEWLMAAEYIAAGGNHNISSASAAYAPSRPRTAMCSTSARFRSSNGRRICRSSSIPRMPAARHGWFQRLAVPPSPPVPTVCSSRFIPTPAKRFAMPTRH
jgi:hypothetical protein